MCDDAAGEVPAVSIVTQRFVLDRKASAVIALPVRRPVSQRAFSRDDSVSGSSVAQRWHTCAKPSWLDPTQTSWQRGITSLFCLLYWHHRCHCSSIVCVWKWVKLSSTCKIKEKRKKQNSSEDSCFKCIIWSDSQSFRLVSLLKQSKNVYLWPLLIETFCFYSLSSWRSAYTPTHFHACVGLSTCASPHWDSNQANHKSLW